MENEAMRDGKAEIVKKNKTIDLIMDFIIILASSVTGTVFKTLRKQGFNNEKCINCPSSKSCKQCLKQYFEKKVEDK